MSEPGRLLVLGGTGEALELASRLAGRYAVTYSLAGRTRVPVSPEGVEVRNGGFGGSEALRRWMLDQDIFAVVDATHPFAARMAHSAASAAEKAGIPRLKLLRSAWEENPGDCWLRVPDLVSAAASLPSGWREVFLSVGRQGLSAFAVVEDVRFLVRTVDPVTEPALKKAMLVTGRGPFKIGEELALLSKYRIDGVVSRNSGGASTYAKIAAARILGLPVVMVERPTPPAGDRAETVEEAAFWVDEIASGAA